MDNETQQDQLQNNEDHFSTQKNSGSFGPLVGSIIIIFIVVAGGIYFFRNVRESSNINKEDSADLEEISTELENTELENLEAELDAIDAEIEAELEISN